LYFFFLINIEQRLFFLKEIEYLGGQRVDWLCFDEKIEFRGEEEGLVGF